MIKAPIDGVVSKKQVQVGQQAQIGVPLMADRARPPTPTSTPTSRKCSSRRCGSASRSTLTSDLYGGGVKFHGRVVGLSGGTGSAFSLIPAQNASGNWIKVVQRLPVRIQLDPQDLAAHPLRIGLSMKAAIDISGAH